MNANNSTSPLISDNGRLTLPLIGSVLAPFCVIPNLMIVITVLRTKELRNRSHYIIASHAISEILRMTIYIISTPSSTSTSEPPPPIDAFNCALRQIYPMAIDSYYKRMCFALALDRFIGVAAPLYYSKIQPKLYVLLVNGLCFGYAFGRSFVYLAATYGDRMIPTCDINLALIPSVLTFNEIDNFASMVLALVMYIATGVCMFRRYSSTSLIGETQKSDWRRRMEFDVFKSVVTIGIIYLVGTLGSTVAGKIITWMPIGWAGTIRPYMSYFFFSMIFFNAASHFVVYLALNSKFRQGVKKIVRRKGNAVVTKVTPMVVTK